MDPRTPTTEDLDWLRRRTDLLAESIRRIVGHFDGSYTGGLASALDPITPQDDAAAVAIHAATLDAADRAADEAAADEAAIAIGLGDTPPHAPRDHAAEAAVPAVDLPATDRPATA